MDFFLSIAQGGNLGYLMNNDLKNAYYYALEGLKGQQDQKDPDLIAYSQWFLARVLAAKGNYGQAIELLKKSTRRFFRSHCLNWLAESLRDLGEIYNLMSQKEKAVKTLRESLEIYKKLGFDHEIIKTMNLAKTLGLKIGFTEIK